MNREATDGGYYITTLELPPSPEGESILQACNPCSLTDHLSNLLLFYGLQRCYCSRSDIGDKESPTRSFPVATAAADVQHPDTDASTIGIMSEEYYTRLPTTTFHPIPPFFTLASSLSKHTCYQLSYPFANYPLCNRPHSAYIIFSSQLDIRYRNLARSETAIHSLHCTPICPFFSHGILFSFCYFPSYADLVIAFLYPWPSAFGSE